MKTGELARRAGVPIDTVRFYERNGLLPPPPRRASGYRDYRDEDLARLKFILRAKSIGFSLMDVGELLTLREHFDGGSDRIKAAAEARLVDIEKRLVELECMRDELRRLIAPETDASVVHADQSRTPGSALRLPGLVEAMPVRGDPRRGVYARRLSEITNERYRLHDEKA